jgi:outer membrane protein TolC
LAALAQAYGLAAKISDQILSAETIFLSVLRAKEGVKVAQASLDAYRVQLRTATELWKGGVGLRIDVDRATSQVASAERDLVQRQNDLNMARAALNDQIGEPLDAEPELTDVPAPAGILGTPRSSERAELLSQAARQRSEARSAELGVKAAEKGIKLARSSTDPTVSLALAGNYYPTTSFSYPRPSTGTLSLNVSIPIYDGGLARARVDDARAALETAKAQANAVRRAISLQAQDAFLDVDTAQKSLAAAEEALKAAVAARELARQRYEGQVGLYLEVTDAQAALTAAQTGRVNALYDLFIAKARLQRALGDLTLPSQPAAKP